MRRVEAGQTSRQDTAEERRRVGEGMARSPPGHTTNIKNKGPRIKHSPRQKIKQY